MNIGFYHDGAGTRHAGGIAVYTQYMAAELSERNDVYLYTQGGELSPLVTESDVTVIETRSFDDHWSRVLEQVTPLDHQSRAKLQMTAWAAYNGILDHIDEHLDILFTFQFLDDLLLSNIVDVPTVYTYHRLSDAGLGTRARERLSQTDLILANSDDTGRKVSAEFGYEVADVIYPGVDLDLFRPDREPAFADDEPTILFVGRLVESKGIDELLEAVAALDGRQKLRFVGRGDENRIQERAAVLGIGDAVVCHGEVPHPELPAYYAGADVFCLPSHDESFGMANVEAMAAGLPVVTSDLEGIKTYLVNGENGLLARSGDSQDLADKLQMVLDSPALRSRLGERARDDVTEFSWVEQAGRLEAFCRDVLDAPVVDATPSEQVQSDAI